MRMLNAKNLAIQIVAKAIKEFLETHLLADDNKATIMLSNVKFNNVFDKFSMLSSPNIHHNIKSFNNVTKWNGYIDSILELKRRIRYDYIQDNVFLDKGVSKVYLFKMSTHWPTSGVDIIVRMQLGGDFENVWIMFNHVKCV